MSRGSEIEKLCQCYGRGEKGRQEGKAKLNRMVGEVESKGSEEE